MEPELEPGFDLNYLVPLSKELPGFSGSGSEPGSITRPIQVLARFSPDILQPFLAYSLIPSGEAILKVCPRKSLDYSTHC